MSMSDTMRPYDMSRRTRHSSGRLLFSGVAVEAFSLRFCGVIAAAVAAVVLAASCSPEP